MNRRLLLPALVLAASVSLTGCANMTSLLVDTATVQQQTEKLAAAYKIGHEQTLQFVSSLLEQSLAESGTYPPTLDGIHDDTDNVIGYAVSPDATGYLLVGAAPNGSRVYKSSVATQMFWTTEEVGALTDISQLIELGVQVPSGIQSVPQVPIPQ